ncbi:MAG: hypothetical protein HFF77_00510 [Oscillospiraceae bacterium]|jgi:hypothetical protein|nr:hypothetical protein [Oscillospiraceae bacterium]
MRKKLLSLALALVLCLGLTVPAAAATMTEIVSPETYYSFCEWAGYTIEGFHEGITWRGHSGGSGYGAFDKNGNIIIPPHSYAIESDPTVMDFSDGAAWARKDNRWHAVDNTGKYLFTLEKNLVPEEDGKSDFHEGLARVYDKETKKYGYVDKTGKVVIPFEHDYRAGNFYDGLAVTYDATNAYYGYMDKTGKVVIPCQYANARHFVNGFAVVQLGNRQTVIDTTGKDLLPQDYSYRSNNWPEDISSEVVPMYQKDSFHYGYAFVNKSGQIVSGGYDFVWGFANGMALVQKDDKYGYVNEAGVLVIPCQYISVSAFEFCDGYALVNSHSIIDKTGKVTGTTNNSAVNAGNGCFRISSSESGRRRYGFIDYTGREIVSCKYAEVKDFSGGVAAVKTFDDKWGFVDTTGAEVVPCTLTEVEYTDEPGVFVVKNFNGDGKMSIIKSSGWTEPSVSSAPSTPSTPAQPSGPSASPTNSKVLVNGKEVAFDAYTIDGSNYFKLRDLAYVLSGTEKQFEVGWDNASKTITLTSGQGYTANGSEMGAKSAGSKAAAVSASKLLIDGKEVALTAYTIDGNNYFKLRDIGQAFDFGIGWDNASKTITIDTSAGYTA